MPPASSACNGVNAKDDIKVVEKEYSAVLQRYEELQSEISHCSNSNDSKITASDIHMLLNDYKYACSRVMFLDARYYDNTYLTYYRKMYMKLCGKWMMTWTEK